MNSKWYWLASFLLVLGCGSNKADKDDRTNGALEILGHPSGADLASGPAVVRGTIIDASSGRPLAGVFVQGPGGSQATSDRDGRFELEGLPLGAPGELLARAQDGREGRNTLRPLKEGTLEVVLFVR